MICRMTTTQEKVHQVRDRIGNPVDAREIPHHVVVQFIVIVTFIHISMTCYSYMVEHTLFDCLKAHTCMMSREVLTFCVIVQRRVAVVATAAPASRHSCSTSASPPSSASQSSLSSSSSRFAATAKTPGIVTVLKSITLWRFYDVHACIMLSHILVPFCV